MANITSLKRHKSETASGVDFSFYGGRATLADGKSSGLATRSRGGLLAAVLAALAAWCGPLWAAPIDIPNGSFESPSTTFADPRVDSWQKTPKPFWYDESGGNLWDQLTGVFRNTAPGGADHIVNCDGNQAVFLFALPQVGFFQDYKSTDWTGAAPAHAFNAKYETGSSYNLTVGVIGGGGGMARGATMEASLYYLDVSSNRITVAATSITNTLESFPNTTNLVDFEVYVPSVKAGDAWAGRNIGVQFISTVLPDLVGGYWDLDNIRLSSISESVFALVFERSGPSLKVTWPSVVGRQYQAQTSDDLTSWASSGAPQSGTGGELYKLVPADGRANAFVRVLSTPGP